LGKRQREAFVRKNLYAALFRDIYGWGYNDLSKEFRNWLGIAGPTLSHNTKLIRKEIGEYFSQFISIGTRSEWDRRASRLSKSKELADVNLFIDSSDFPLEGTNSSSTKSLFRSFKQNGLGIRFMFVVDANGMIRFVSPGYTPKLYDGHFLELYKPYFEEKFTNSCMIGDMHFEKGKEIFNNVTFKVPVRQPNSSKRTSDGRPIPQLNETLRRYNENHKTLRNQVELPFAKLTSMFYSLNIPWKENISQLEYLVTIGAGVINKRI